MSQMTIVPGFVGAGHIFNSPCVVLSFVVHISVQPDPLLPSLSSMMCEPPQDVPLGLLISSLYSSFCWRFFSFHLLSVALSSSSHGRFDASNLLQQIWNWNYINQSRLVCLSNCWKNIVKELCFAIPKDTNGICPAS